MFSDNENEVRLVKTDPAVPSSPFRGAQYRTRFLGHQWGMSGYGPEDRPGLMPRHHHGDPLGDTQVDQVADRGAAEVVA